MSRQQQYLALSYLIGIQLCLLTATSCQAQDTVKTTTTTIEKTNGSAPTTGASTPATATVSANLTALATTDSELRKAADLEASKSTLASGNSVMLSTVAPVIKAIDAAASGGQAAAAVAASVGLKLSSVAGAGDSPTSASVESGKILASSMNEKTQVTTTSKFLSEAQPDDKFDQYFAPICESLDKLEPKQLFKIQSQLKQFVEKTNGKMSVCFMTHFKMNPGMSAIEKSQLESICLAKKLANDATGSFGMFKNCATHNWDQQLGKQLDMIIAARSNCVKNHNHSATSNGTASLLHDDPAGGEDEGDMGIIGDVVSKVLEGSKDVVSKSDIKFVDMATNSPTATAIAATTTVAPKLISPSPSLVSLDSSASSGKSLIQLTAPAHTNTVSPTSVKSTTAAPVGDLVGDLAAAISSNNQNKSKLLNDPNTVFVFVDETSSKSSSTPKPDILQPLTSSSSKIEQKTVHATQSETTVETKIATISTTVAPNTVVKPLVLGGKISSIKSKIAALTTKKPVSNKVASTKKPAAKPEPLKNLIKSVDNLETFQEMIIRQEKEKQELDRKLKIEREKLIGQLKKKQDEMDAKNAIKQLQLQRAASIGHQGHSDARMHQIEHERQMAIDPIGHSIKHQQYEYSKQQRALKVAVKGENQTIKKN